MKLSTTPLGARASQSTVTVGVAQRSAGVRAAASAIAPGVHRNAVFPTDLSRGVAAARVPARSVTAAASATEPLPWQAAMSDVKKRKDIKSIMSESSTSERMRMSPAEGTGARGNMALEFT